MNKKEKSKMWTRIIAWILIGATLLGAVATVIYALLAR